jgi:hypothetical protein
MEEKTDARWSTILEKQEVKIGPLKANARRRSGRRTCPLAELCASQRGSPPPYFALFLKKYRDLDEKK